MKLKTVLKVAVYIVASEASGLKHQMLKFEFFMCLLVLKISLNVELLVTIFKRKILTLLQLCKWSTQQLLL